MVDVTGAPVPLGSSPFDVPGDLKDLADHFGGPGMFAVANAAALPTTGNWTGRTLWVQSLGQPREWDGTGWVNPTIMGVYQVTSFATTNGVVANASTFTLDTANSHALASTYWQPAAGSLSFVVPGVYLIQFDAGWSPGVTGRSFINLSLSGQESRNPVGGPVETRAQAVLLARVASGSQSLVVSAFQTTGNVNVSGQLRVTHLGTP